MNARRAGLLAFVAYVATIVAANWAVERYGIVRVGFGLTAPAGVFFAGLAFTLRDVTQLTLGKRIAIAAIVVGTLVSLLVSTRFALASGTAFLLSELADFFVYTPIQRAAFVPAVVVSNVVGAVVDSAIFLQLAFDSLEFLPGQVVGKLLMTAAALPIVWAGRRRAEALLA